MVHSYSQDITFSHINSISYIFMQVLSPLHVNILYLFPFSWFYMCMLGTWWFLMEIDGNYRRMNEDCREIDLI